MRYRTRCLKVGLICGAAGLAVQPTVAQIITLGDVINTLVNLDTTVTVLGQNVVGLDAQVQAQASLLTSLNSQVTNNTGSIASLQVDVNALNGQVLGNTTAITALQVDLAANGLRDDGQDSAIAGLTAGLAANTAHDTVQDGQIGSLTAGLAANNLRDDGQDASIAGLATGLAANVSRLDDHDTAIAGLGAGLAANSTRLDGHDADIAGLTTGVAANGSRLDAHDTAIAGLGAGLAANGLRDDGQDAAIAGLTTGLAAAGTRLDGHDTAISGLTAGLAANVARDDEQDARLAYNEATLAQHDTRIAEARQIGTTALASAAQVRDDVEAGRIGLVRTAADGNLAVGAGLGGSAVSFAGTGGDRRLTGVANGVAANDAVTVAQLQASSAAVLAAANDYTDGRLVGLNNSFLSRIAESNQELRTEINAAAASTAALAGLPQAFVPGKGMIAMGIGGKGDQAAIAFGIGKAFNHPNTPVLRAGAAVNTGNGDVTYNAAMGIHF